MMVSCEEPEPQSSCNDGIRNGTETGVDCGGDCIACATCDDGMQNGNETGVDCGGDCDPCYGVGLPGEAGGVIFYDKEFYSNGWRYLEASLTDFDDINPCWNVWVNDMNDLGTTPELGAGMSNTDAIRSFSGGTFPSNLETALDLNGYSDWYVPSKLEAFEIYQNQHLVPNLQQGGECENYIISTFERIPGQTRYLTPALVMGTGEYIFPDPAQTIRLIRQF